MVRRAHRCAAPVSSRLGRGAHAHVSPRMFERQSRWFRSAGESATVNSVAVASPRASHTCVVQDSPGRSRSLRSVDGSVAGGRALGREDGRHEARLGLSPGPRCTPVVLTGPTGAWCLVSADAPRSGSFANQCLVPGIQCVAMWRMVSSRLAVVFVGLPVTPGTSIQRCGRWMHFVGHSRADASASSREFA